MPVLSRRIPLDQGSPPGGEPGASLSPRQWAALAVLWVAGTIALLLFRPGYPFPPFELLDSWFYTSYQWDLRNQIIDFGATYYESRLTWILPGTLLHSLLPPVVAEICFKLSVSALFALACGAIVHRAAGFPATMLAVTLSLFTPQFIAGLHADYIDTPVIVYAALTLACITSARHSRWWAGWIFLGGCSFAAMTIANLSSLGTPGLGIAVFHLLWLRWGFKRQLASLGLYLLSALIVIAVIGGIHVQLGGAFHFLKPQIDMMLYFHGAKSNPWSAANWLWVYGATWLVLPVTTLLWGARSSLSRPPAAGQEARRLILALTAALFVSLAWALQLEIKGVGVLLYYYYASYHLCFALPLLAALCWSGTEPASKPLIWAGILALALILFSFIGKPLVAWTSLVPFHRFVLTPESMPLLGAGALLLAGLLLAVLAALKLLPPAVRRCCRPEIMVLGLIACSTSTGFHGREISDHLRERYSLIYRTYHLLAREFPQGSYVFWVHPAERNGVSLASTKLWGYRMITDKGFPELGPTKFTEKTVIIPCSPGRGAETLVTATQTLDVFGIGLVNPRIIPVGGEAGLGFDLVCFSMQWQPVDPEFPPSGIKPPVMMLAFLATGESPYTASLGSVIRHPDRGAGLDRSQGHPVFTPSAPGDHMATQYHSIAPGAPGQIRQVSVVTIMPAAGNCLLTVQDENFRNLAHFQLTDSGRAVHRIELPADATRIRVVFESPEDAPTVLPEQIRIYQIPD